MYIMWIFFFLQLMNTEFDIISQARNPCKINLAKYNHNTMEFITFGPGYFVVCFKFWCRSFCLENTYSEKIE